MCRATGSTSTRRPSRTADPIRSGRAPSSSAAASARASICARERASEASSCAGATRPAVASAILALARSSAWSSTGRRLRSESDGLERARVRAASGADRAAAAGERDASRLLVYERATGSVRHRVFAELPQELHDELVVVNDTRVVPARLDLRRASGGVAEVLLLERLDGNGTWEALARPSRKLRAGRPAGAGRAARVARRRALAAAAERRPGRSDAAAALHHRAAGRPAPLPDRLRGRAGVGRRADGGTSLHARASGRLEVERVTLHVGLDTFRPLVTETLDEHELHGERYSVRPEAWARIEAADRVLAVGTTSVRVLETVSRGSPLRGSHVALRHAGFRVPSCRRVADELPPAALDAARVGDGVRRRRGDAPALRARDRRALPVLLLRRRDADPVNRHTIGTLSLQTTPDF